MPAVSKYRMIERKMGKPMPEVLTEAFQEHGQHKLVAEHLGVSQGTLSNWLKILGYEQKTILVKREKIA